MTILETERLILRQIFTDDAEFMLSLLNEPDWIKYIGDRGIQTVEAAKQYIQDGPMTMYEEYGIGLYLVELKESETPIGICGLIQRDFLKDVDLGFAISLKYWGCGYACEAANAILTYGTEVLGFRRIVGFTSLDNEKSANLLLKLGMNEEGKMKFVSMTEDVRLFAINYE
ncbi:GNAT family N-acetyltransferase [Paenisporosarcina sp. TG-14]|uniref:GNAT family N-acetyltransferase n=1 Tax=Paenisporosarcina sp. TG-14 TaxID=1231057 RepID=UPI000306852A|nr:GNAT family N-acetyltransferase [Paenisporosarcina sp. TG-14]